MSYVLYLLVAILVLDSLRMRGRIGKLAVLGESDAPATGFRVYSAPGVEVKAETVRAAAAYARDHKLALLDLVPRNLGAMRALAFAQLVDPAAYREDRIGPGRTVGHAFLVADDVAERARAIAPTDDVELAKLAANLKHYGPADAVVAPAERAVGLDITKRYQLLFVVLGPSTPLALGMLVVMWALIGLGLWRSPIAGLVALGAWQLQPLISLAFTKVHSTDLVPFTILRAPIE